MAAAERASIVGIVVVAAAGAAQDGRNWLVQPIGEPARAHASDAEVVLDNGLVRRTIRLLPDAATVALDDLRTGASLLRRCGRRRKWPSTAGPTTSAVCAANRTTPTSPTRGWRR